MEGNVTKKNKLLARLITAKTRNQWLPRKELLKIASAGYLDKLLRVFICDGLIERTGSKRRYKYRATELAVSTFLEEGPLPRTPLTRMKASERPRGHLVQLRPVTQLLDVESIWMEHQRVYFRLDQFTSKLLRGFCNPPAKKDRALQMSFSNASFVITISKHGNCTLILKEPKWQESLVKWMLSCGLSKSGCNSTLSLVKAQLPESIKRMEMPVLDPTLKARDVTFAVSTKVGESKIISNINYSTNIDFEVVGQDWLVDIWLAALGATQHNLVVVHEALKEEVAELAKKVNELQKEREVAEKKQSDDDDEGASAVSYIV